MELRRRTVAKTFTYRAIGMAVTASVAWGVTGSPALALGISAGDMFLKLLVYYAHERIWIRIPFGKARPPEYNI